jgi:phospholipase D1/2
VTAALLRAGETCWRVERADRLAFLVDADDYFTAFRHAVLAARRSVMIVGWDVDSRVRLTSDPQPPDGYPPTLLAFLNAVLRDRPDLQVHVLAWDFSMIYTFEREMLPSYKFGWRGHRRLHFALDASQLGVSHHQKIVVVDDRVAFTGGLDLTIRRWDSSDHRLADSRRVDPGGEIYSPIHDVQVAVEGPVAAALGDLVRERWSRATGRRLEPGDGSSDPWPPDLRADLSGVAVGVARTAPPVREVAALTLQAISAARRLIFIENQYLTSGSVGEALAHRLAEPDGPEIVLVLPRVESGWLEQSSMGILRARLLARLVSEDRHGRLHVLYPVIDGAAINVHSKVLVVDDSFLKVGSANLSNRSMSLDSECDLAVEGTASDQRTRDAIAELRCRLVGEHLGVSSEQVRNEMARGGSLARAIEAFRGGRRSLEPLAEGHQPVVNLAIFDGLVCDPERPIAAEGLFDHFVPREARPPMRRVLVGVAAGLVALASFAVIWRLSPVTRALGLEGMARALVWLRHYPAAPLFILGGFLVGALAVVPGTLLIGGTVLLNGWPAGVAWAWIGSIVAATLNHLFGRWFARRVRQRWRSEAMWLRGQLRKRGNTAVALARLVPVGNFFAMNMVAGALRVPLGPFLISTGLGLLPGLFTLAIFTELVRRALRQPGTVNLFLLLLVTFAIGAGLWWLARRLAHGQSTPVLAPPRTDS